MVKKMVRELLLKDEIFKTFDPKAQRFSDPEIESTEANSQSRNIHSVDETWLLPEEN
jgi:hypothetical protein